MKNKTIRLADYRPPAWLIERTELDFDLQPGDTRVVSRLQVRANPEAASGQPLVLDGQDLHLEAIVLDGRPLEAGAYQCDGHQLSLDPPGKTFRLEITTRIRPAANTALEGLYMSDGMFCTQCEAEGFRRITYYPDRPDVMSHFTTRIVADPQAFPVLLSNGNPVSSRVLDDGRHEAVWDDPFPKPAYLFALVAGDLCLHQDSFTTRSGREVAIRVYTDHHNQGRCDHAISALKNAMRWDEKVYGREYDLDIFMIVAVDAFNMGAMENKGLNIFNAACVLASPETTTDDAYQRIEAIVAHEYFHNWSGNRVTCRDWFQLSLKEGFTVFRDAAFSADIHDRAVKRIEDVRLLRSMQFVEDAGPMAHPVRPAEYQEISNFYTLTVYEKGAEVVRMIHRLAGPAGFRRGADLYFERHDGQAVCVEDFVRAMEDANGLDLGQFMRWYEQAGTPVLEARDEWNPHARTWTLHLAQSCPASPGQPEKQPFLVPVEVGLLDTGGRPLMLNGEPSPVLKLTQPRQSFVFENVSHRPGAPSLLRGFTAPVKLRYDWTPAQLQLLIAHDEDPFNRWDALQSLTLMQVQALVQGRTPDLGAFVSALEVVLHDARLGMAMKAEMLSLADENWLSEAFDPIPVDEIHMARERLVACLAEQARPALEALYEQRCPDAAWSIAPEAIARRRLHNQALSLLARFGEGQVLAQAQFDSATSMTDQMAALAALVNHGDAQLARAVLDRFEAQWHDEPLVMNQWFAVQAASPRWGTLERVKALCDHPAFTLNNPNKVRSVLGAFSRNAVQFHAAGGAGYAFLGDRVRALDSLNPQIAARLVTPLTHWKRYAVDRAGAMRKALEHLAAGSMSPDLEEIVSKSLG
jgi:aminopeptidase N